MKPQAITEHLLCKRLNILQSFLKLSCLSSFLLLFTLLTLYDLPFFKYNSSQVPISLNSSPAAVQISSSSSTPFHYENRRITLPTLSDLSLEEKPSFDHHHQTLLSTIDYNNSLLHEDDHDHQTLTLSSSSSTTPLSNSNLDEKPSFHQTLSSIIAHNKSSNHNETLVSTSSLAKQNLLRRVQGECDITKGEWVRDQEAPFYTNNTCYLIQEHQNCMKYGRPDSEYLKWRWRPDGCELLRFDPRRFLELVRNKNIAFIGDSLARNQMQSLICLLSRVEYPEDISSTSDENFKRMHYPSYNFTIFKFWSPFLVRAEEAPAKHFFAPAWKIYVDEVDNRWSSRIQDFDYIIISGGNWFTRPSLYYRHRRLIGCQYCKTPPTKKTKPMIMYYPHRTAFRTAFRAITEHPIYKGLTFLRTVSPSHFENGAWNDGGDCQRTMPYSKGQTKPEQSEMGLYFDQLKEFRRARREGKEKNMRFSLLDMTGAMLMLPDGHPSKYGHRPEEMVVMYNDCVHWCLPGPVDTWNEFLLYELERQQL